MRDLAQGQASNHRPTSKECPVTKPGRPDAAELLRAAEEAYATYHSGVTADPDSPALHLAPPVGRLNDPNGLNPGLGFCQWRMFMFPLAL